MGGEAYRAGWEDCAGLGRIAAQGEEGRRRGEAGVWKL